MNSNLEPLSWDIINWTSIQKEVKNLQSRIFLSKQENNHRKLRRLQKLLFLSRSNILLSIQKPLPIEPAMFLSPLLTISLFLTNSKPSQSTKNPKNS